MEDFSPITIRHLVCLQVLSFQVWMLCFQVGMLCFRMWVLSYKNGIDVLHVIRQANRRTSIEF